jgi:hypothetical protein
MHILRPPTSPAPPAPAPSLTTAGCHAVAGIAAAGGLLLGYAKSKRQPLTLTGVPLGGRSARRSRRDATHTGSAAGRRIAAGDDHTIECALPCSSPWRGRYRRAPRVTSGDRPIFTHFNARSPATQSGIAAAERRRGIHLS